MTTYSPRLKERYNAEIIQGLTEQFGYTSVMRVPKLKKTGRIRKALRVGKQF